MSGKHFMAAMYLRLSRDDSDVGDEQEKYGGVKCESNSISNQRKLIRTFIDGQRDVELYDVYADDGFSGSNFDRPEFKRMMGDIEAGKVNLVIVKDLSRFGRDYIETGRYIQKIFPALSVRFIALTDNYDSFKADDGESGIILPVRNFINDSYCRDISAKVKSQFEVKRKNGECIAPFALYGYLKSESNKNQLVVDECAAENVRKIFEWKMEGFAISAIAEKLNGLGILSPREYKKYKGANYNGGFWNSSKSHWSSAAVKRILTNEMYLGHMVQGKTEKINYKLAKVVQKPQSEWIKVEHTHEAVISEETFRIVQNLLKSDGRISMISQKNSPFTGILFCADCREQMIRRVNRYKDKQKIYYICSGKNRGEGCTRHAISEERLKELVTETIRRYADYFTQVSKISECFAQKQSDLEAISYCEKEMERLKDEEKKYRSLNLCLHKDLEKEIITPEEYKRLKSELEGKIEEVSDAQKRQCAMMDKLFECAIMSEEELNRIQESMKLKYIDRYTLCSMVKRISVFEDKRVEIEFYYTDKYRDALQKNLLGYDKKLKTVRVKGGA